MSSPSPHPASSGDRRPIAARRWPLWQPVVRWLVRHQVSANAISVAGMFFAVAAGFLLAATPSLSPLNQRLAWLAAALLIQLRLLANLLDGMVAIESGKASALGEIFNEVPDRVSDTAVLVGAGYAVGGHVGLGYAAACAAMFTAYVRVMGKASGCPSDFRGPMAKQQRMAVMTVLALVFAVAPGSLQPQLHTLWGVGLTTVGLIVITVGGLLTALRRLLRVMSILGGGAA